MSEELTLNDKIMNTTFFVCKCCNMEKVRTLIGVFPNGDDPKYHDEHGRQWNGRCCPDCHNTKLKVRQKMKRAVYANNNKMQAKRQKRYRRNVKHKEYLNAAKPIKPSE